MSSGVDTAGTIAVAAVGLSVAAAYGVGWVAWQGGKLLIDANSMADRMIAEKKRQMEEAARHRKMAAVAAHDQLVDMCSQIITKIDSDSSLNSLIPIADLVQLRTELESVINESLPEDTDHIEDMTSKGYLKLESVVRRHNKISSMTMSDSTSGIYSGLSVADLMDDIRLVVETMKVQATKGENVKAADPEVLERMKLNDELSQVTSDIMMALENVEVLSVTYGLSAASKAWFQSCFNGIDEQIEVLCRPTTSNKSLKNGIRRLNDAMENYNVMAPSIEKETKRKKALYDVYKDAAKALGERVKSIKSFKSAEEIEETLCYFQERAKRAQECSEIYKKLGQTAYICYAWDQELSALGYEVHSRQEISEMAEGKPSRAIVEGKKLPFYEWKDSDLTQLYSISSQCDLQVVVHEDGSVSLQTLAATGSKEVINDQQIHCSQLKVLHENLRKNWFILCDYTETKTADEIETVAQWRESEDNIWRKADLITDQRTKDRETEKAKHMK